MKMMRIVKIVVEKKVVKEQVRKYLKNLLQKSHNRWMKNKIVKCLKEFNKWFQNNKIGIKDPEEQLPTEDPLL
jgi:hypothetical protein